MSVTTEDPIALSVNNGHSGCLLCGNLNPRSLNLSFLVAEDGTVETRFQAYAELQGYDGVLHGGIIAALLDAAMTHCLFHRGIQAVTGDLHVKFVNPIPCDAQLEIRAWVVASRRSLYRLKAEIKCDNKIMAWSEATFMRRQTHSDAAMEETYVSFP